MSRIATKKEEKFLQERYRAYELGSKAYQAGKPLSTNPYEHKTDNWHSWRSGWEDHN